MPDLHVVFGAGPLGRAVAKETSRLGLPTRVVNRSGRIFDLPAGVEAFAADVTHADSAVRAAEGARVVYNCIAPPAYSAKVWEEWLLPMWTNLLDAAAAAGAKLVIGDNVYVYDAAPGPIREDRPMDAPSRKGRTRIRAAEAMLKAHGEGRAQVAFGRASDFFGPWARASHLGSSVFGKLLHGKPAQYLGDPDLPHSFTFIDDFGKALVVLGQRAEAVGEVWHVPTPPVTTTREIVGRVAAMVGVRPRVQTMPPWLATAVTWVSPSLRELAETSYQRSRPYVLDSSKFQRTFGMSPTSLDDALKATVDWFRTHGP